MIENIENLNNFYKSIVDTSQNSLNFEYVMESEEYINTELSYAQKTNTNLHLNNLIFVDKYYDKIFEDAIPFSIDRKNQGKYYRNPKLLSYDRYGTIDYWYLILIMNGWKCAYEMTDLNRELLLPNPTTISNIITDEEFYNK